MSRSHCFGKSIQQIAAEESVGRDDVTESHLTEWARRFDPDCELIRPDMSDGDAILFDGRLWHGSDNTNRRGVRTALLLQYASPETPIRIPDPSVLEWPFQFQQRPRPACIMVSGTNSATVNRMVAPPSRALRGRGTMAQWIRQLDLPLEGDGAVGWKPYSIFHSPTPTLSDLSCHVSVLEPGRSPHPPHQHDHEEVLIMLSGEAGLVIVNAKTGKEETSIVRRGDLVYYPAKMPHTIRNDAAEPTTYLMFKWRELSRSRGDALGLELHRANGGLGTAMATGLVAARGFSAQPVLHGPTRYLRALHCHRSILQPGGSYDPHADPYDVAIIVLKGTVETLGERLGPDAVIFYGAGLEHGMQNPGDEPAEYLVFEFHGIRGRSPVIQFWRRALRATIRRAPGVRSLQRRLSSKRKGH
ncbi:MAG: cupin domain-containing protein [Rhodothermales bacterium]|nr:cupin domain-containing protein [Rhodothermales bacterium]